MQMYGRRHWITRRSIFASIAMLITPQLVLAQPSKPPSPLAPRTRHALGARLPPNIRDRIKAQNVSAEALNKLLAEDPAYAKAVSAAQIFSSPAKLPRQYDLRTIGIISPVKNQDPCGSCWAFAAVAAYESSYAKINKSIEYVSEQQLVDCTFADADCVLGGFHEEAFLYLQLEGLAKTDPYYYRGAKGACTSNIERPYRAANWGYVSDDKPNGSLIPSNQALKRAMIRFGALATGVWVSDKDDTLPWASYGPADAWGNPNPDWLRYPDHVFRQGIPSTALQPENVNHEVAIVGWDDDLAGGVWFIKNSWGTTWGDAGFMKLPYGQNNIGSAASWVIAEPAPAPAPALPVSTAH
jgi:hypothetical protein